MDTNTLIISAIILFILIMLAGCFNLIMWLQKIILITLIIALIGVIIAVFDYKNKD
ncbi:MAG: hypothetical protein K0R54_108 [Clostridiaceae bacterium]|jgi:hypothetical protein|nr:hypothetical protein [Clostridiaceae bacterium]